jgi:hypothetical protein
MVEGHMTLEWVLPFDTPFDEIGDLPLGIINLALVDDDTQIADYDHMAQELVLTWTEGAWVMRFVGDTGTADSYEFIVFDRHGVPVYADEGKVPSGIPC